MSAQTASLPSYPVDLRAEFEDLQRALFPIFLLLILVLPLIWLIHAAKRDWRAENLYLIDLAVLVSVITSFFSLSIRENHFSFSKWFFILSLIFANGLWVSAYPLPRTIAFGILIVIISKTLLDDLPSILCVSLHVATVIFAMSWGTGSTLLMAELLWILVFYALVWLLTWLATRPLHTAIARSLMGWEHAFTLVRQVQERRGELYRALRALEEATYRIERMNNELLIAQREAETARAHKERFVATVSHEIRGPLNLILGYSRLMALSPERYGEILPLPYRRDMATVYRSSRHLADLIDDILDLSQIEAESLPLVKDRIDLETDVIHKALDMVRPLAERKGLYVRYEPAGRLGEVLADAVRLRQVMINILLNAVRFTERGGVTVQTEQGAEEIVVSIQDTGPGIAKKDRARMFQEFHKAHLPEDPEDKGSGLGLAISKHLVDLHAGRIWVESQPGVGTTFHFALPLPGGHSASVGLIKEGYQKSPSTGDRHVIAHAPLHVIRLLSRRMEGYRILGVTNPNEIPLLVDEIHPHALLLGAEIANDLWAKLSQCTYDVPIVHCCMPHIEEGQLESALAYLIKPIAAETVMTVMRQVERDGETDVLLVDDDPDAVQLLEAMLLALPRPYNILKAYDGQQALEIMEEIVPDIVFLDILMPGMDGHETMLRMRADERLRSVPVAIVSARDIDEDMLVVNTPITLHRKGSVDMSTMAELLKAMLDRIGPDYLSGRSF